jgi:hypothetical protein
MLFVPLYLILQTWFGCAWTGRWRMAALVPVDRIRPRPDHCPASAIPRLQPVAAGCDLFCAAGIYVSIGRRHRAPSRQQAESGLNTSMGGEISDVQEVANASCRKALSIGAGGGNRTRICSLGSCRSTTELRPQTQNYQGLRVYVTVLDTYWVPHMTDLVLGQRTTRPQVRPMAALPHEVLVRAL